MEPRELLRTVDRLSKAGKTQKEICQELGFSTLFTLNSNLVRASQATGKPIPSFRQGRKAGMEKQVDFVEVKKRGKGGNTFGDNIPMAPLIQAGFQIGTKFSVTASKGKIVLRVPAQ